MKICNLNDTKMTPLMTPFLQEMIPMTLLSFKIPIFLNIIRYTIRYNYRIIDVFKDSKASLVSSSSVEVSLNVSFYCHWMCHYLIFDNWIFYEKGDNK